MRLYFCIWRLGLSIKVLDFTFETASFFYFGFRFWLGKYGVEMSLYRPRKGGFRYRFELPLLFVMNDAIVHGRRRILPAVAILQGEYGQSDMAMGVPCVLSDCGVEKIIELPLNDVEQAMFNDSVASIRADINNLK